MRLAWVLQDDVGMCKICAGQELTVLSSWPFFMFMPKIPPIMETKANMAMTAVTNRSRATSSLRLHHQSSCKGSLGNAADPSMLRLRTCVSSHK